MRPPVLGERRLVRARGERAFLAEGDDLHAVARDAEAREVVARRAGALLAEREVVLGRAALVAVALDRDVSAALALQPVRVLLEDAARLVAERRAVELEVDVGERAAFARPGQGGGVAELRAGGALVADSLHIGSRVHGLRPAPGARGVGGRRATLAGLRVGERGPALS